MEIAFKSSRLGIYLHFVDSLISPLVPQQTWTYPHFCWGLFCKHKFTVVSGGAIDPMMRNKKKAPQCLSCTWAKDLLFAKNITTFYY
jgi:hypothetical protein